MELTEEITEGLFWGNPELRDTLQTLNYICITGESKWGEIMNKNTLNGESLRQEVAPFYRDLLSTISDSYSTDQELTGFSALVGSQYDKSNSRLMVFGRAVDGWRNSWHYNSPVEESLTKILNVPEADKLAECEMNWILRNREKWLHAKDGTKDKYYNYKFSSFWCGTREVLKALEKDHVLNESEWPSQLVWSNAYKISPKRGNPQDKLRSLQIPQCIKILQKEIQYLEPRNILFITGGWGVKILESIGIKSETLTNEIVQSTGRYKGAKVVVAIRPERQKRSRWVNKVVSAFRGLDNHA